MAISKDWWDAWWEADYSWDGLAKKNWQGWRVPIDSGGADCGAPLPEDEVEDGAETRDANLQDYWRRAGILEADLIPMPGDVGKRFTLMHLPPQWPDGTPIEKADPGKPRQGFLEFLQAELSFVIKDTASDGMGRVNGVDHRLQWQGAVLPPFSLSLYSLQTRTENGEIPVGLQCSGAAFTGGADFASATFNGEADFGGVAFSGLADFSSAAFSGRATFARATFCSMAYFRTAAFSHQSNFVSATFSRNVDFEGAAFSERVDFRYAAFSRLAEFPSAVFSGGAIFAGATFSSRAIFKNATFSRRTFFMSVAFFDEADFAEVAFFSKVNFSNALFLSGVTFSGMSRSTRSDPSEAELSLILDDCGPAIGTITNKPLPLWTAKRAFIDADFEGAQFFGHAAFDNRDFHTAANFDGARFFRGAWFQGSDLHKGLSFTRTDFEQALSPKARSLSGVNEVALQRLHAASPVPEDETEKPDFDTWRKALMAELKTENKEAAKDEDRYFERVEDGFRSLKQIMEERRDRSAESRFFKLELKARRKRRDHQVPWWESPISWTFEALSDFGTSVFRPVFWLFGFAGLFACLYQVMGGGAFVSADMLDTLRFSLSRVFPFGPWAEVDSMAEICDGITRCNEPVSTIGMLLTPADNWQLVNKLPYNSGTDILISLLAVLQSFLSIVLVFLSALAVRRRFQIN